jgi:hypothetical protein
MRFMPAIVPNSCQVIELSFLSGSHIHKAAPRASIQRGCVGRLQHATAPSERSASRRASHEHDGGPKVHDTDKETETFTNFP